MRRRGRALIPALVAAASLTLAAPAGADSIAYVKSGDVWLASSDGARRIQVTKTGDYGFVSQADDGTMIALTDGERLRRLARTGRVLAEFPTFVSDGAPTSGPVNEFHGPFAPEISPDGKLVAFEWFNETYDNGTSAGCSATSTPPCHVFSSRQGVGITRSDGFTGFEEFGLMTGWIAPQWLSGDLLLRSGSGAVMNEDAVFTTVGRGKADEELRRWFWDDSGIGVDEVELARDQRTAVGVAGYADEFLRVYRPLYDPLSAPAQNLMPFAQNTPVVEVCAELTGPAGRFESPTLSADGRTLAYGDDRGIWITPVPDLSAGCQPADRGRLAIPGGRFAHWGPAGLPKKKTVAAKRRHHHTKGHGSR
jgi:hypothetical protein